MTEITIEKKQELLNNSEFVEKLLNVKSIEEEIVLFEEYDISITAAEIEDNCKKVMSYLEEKGYIKNGELSEDALEMVAGGGYADDLRYKLAKWCAGASGAGFALAMVGGAAIATPAAGLCIVAGLCAFGLVLS